MNLKPAIKALLLLAVAAVVWYGLLLGRWPGDGQLHPTLHGNFTSGYHIK